RNMLHGLPNWKQWQMLRLHTRTKCITKQIQAMTEKQKEALAKKVLANGKGKKVTPLELRKMVLQELQKEEEMKELKEILQNDKKVIWRRPKKEM
ncbi:MAG: hypothetical protein J6V61_05050, partial [Bacteroidaceae bacterium]|nr:hypothetical protein [Bacteroidaceae bacterium]